MVTCKASPIFDDCCPHFPMIKKKKKKREASERHRILVKGNFKFRPAGKT